MLKAGVPLGFRNSTFFKFGSNISVPLTPASAFFCQTFQVRANLGVLIATLVTGFVIYYAVGMSLIVALLFGSMLSATDPISVLSIFKEVAAEERLSVAC